MSIPERSTSRDRASGFQLTGRGGAGNFRSPSREPATNGPEDYSDTRGRDPISAHDPYVVASTGRGGAGNIRSPSRDAIHAENGTPETSPIRSELRGRGYDRDLISVIDNSHDTGVHSTGRGGIGNMTNSRPNSQSRSRSREPAHASVRGGFGNVYAGGPTEKTIEELDSAAHLKSRAVNSSGRGGAGNFTVNESKYSEGGAEITSANGHDNESFGGRGIMSNFGNMNTNYGHGILGAVAGAILGSKVEDEVRRRSQHK
ncbi:hypothetical protein DFH94DRAFT_755045 [Russula ochroleuca]|uniref:Uncharacterized protein n=1 Tax=Russula ochroleuca TaxID=152965 RepID=A0A9P5MSG4_9AGAM|nr:hypothetical protein DFH94DRAFT_755045 [Russula ochroleuca]